MNDLVMLGASLVTILVVSWLVGRVGLGSDPRIRSKDEALALADSIICGFDGRDVVIDRAGFAAIVRNDHDEQMLIRAHGNHFVGRLIDASFTGRLSHNQLTLAPAERTFGPTTLDLGKEAGAWAASLRMILK